MSPGRPSRRCNLSCAINLASVITFGDLAFWHGLAGVVHPNLALGVAVGQESDRARLARWRGGWEGR